MSPVPKGRVLRCTNCSARLGAAERRSRAADRCHVCKLASWKAHRAAAAPLPVEPHVDAAAQLQAAREALEGGDWRTAAATCIVAVPWYWWLQGDRLGARLLIKVLELRVEADLGGPVQVDEQKPEPTASSVTAAPHVVLVGGIGRMGALYADEAARQGVVLRHYERRLPPITVEPAAVLVITSCVAHPQRERAEEIGRKARCPVRYLDRPSRGALADALASLRRSA